MHYIQKNINLQYKCLRQRLLSEMRITLILLIVYSLIHATLTQSVPHDIHCNFHYRNELYYCSLNDVNIITDTVPLRFFNVHLPNHNDGNVTGIDSWFMTPRNINIRVLHPQLLQQFPNVQFMQFGDSQVENLVAESFQSCDELIGLSLDRNALTSIPLQVFQNCTKLLALDLGIHSQMLMASELFYGLQNLQTLRIGRLMVSNTIFEYMPRIRRLHLTHISGIESNALRHMTQIEFIEISDNALSLSVIQNAIDGLGNLSRINLNRNRFTSVDYKFFEQFENLDEFELIGNQLTTIPANSFENYRNLKILRLHSNQISMLTEESFAGLHALETLTLNHNRLLHLPPNVFHELINLKFLELSDNFIPTIGIESFNGLQSLDTLFINNIQLSNPLPGMFEPLQNLQVLQIIDGSLVNIPPNIFSPMKNLRNLHLGGNRITRLNSNSFGYLPFLESFLISHSTLNEGLNEIERNFFSNFPRLVRFGGFIGRTCIDHNDIVNMTLIDFEGETVFDRCFSNWDAITTPTTTDESNTTPDSSNAVASTAKLFFILILTAITTTIF